MGSWTVYMPDWRFFLCTAAHIYFFSARNLNWFLRSSLKEELVHSILSMVEFFVDLLIPGVLRIHLRQFPFLVDECTRYLV